jgi:hypothetical protein
VLALFEPQVYPDRTTANGEAERPYDVAGWTLPMSMGVNTQLLTNLTEPPNERKLTLIKSENDVRKDLALPLWTSDKSPIANPVQTRHSRRDLSEFAQRQYGRGMDSLCLRRVQRALQISK